MKLFWVHAATPSDARSYTVFSTPMGLMCRVRLFKGLATASKILQCVRDDPSQGWTASNACTAPPLCTAKPETARSSPLIPQLPRRHCITLSRAKSKLVESLLDVMATIGICRPLNMSLQSECFRHPAAHRNCTASSNLEDFRHRFINNTATRSAPLHNLTKKSAIWQWTTTKQNAFDDINQATSYEIILPTLTNDGWLICTCRSNGEKMHRPDLQRSSTCS